MNAEHVVIRYRRPPDRIQHFEQRVVLRAPDCVITLFEHAAIERTMLIDNAIALEPGAPVVWFTFPGAWHDIGRFHTRAGEFTGLYANVLTPVDGIDTGEWSTTDLYLDLWQPHRGPARILDADELDAARTAGVIDAPLATRAQDEAARLLDSARAGAWPPAIVEAWPLERVQRHVRTEAGVTKPAP